MRRKIVPLEERLKTPVISMVPLIVREQLEDLARADKVSLSEIGRRALQAFVEKQHA
jgi:hypothetical protein